MAEGVWQICVSGYFAGTREKDLVDAGGRATATGVILLYSPSPRLPPTPGKSLLRQVSAKMQQGSGEEWPGPKVSIIVDSLQDVRNNISELRDEVHALRASDTEKTASIATLNDEIATLNGEIATLNAKIERIIGVLGDRV